MKYKIIYKKRKTMHGYIGLHSHVPYVRLHVPTNQIWIQKEIHDRNPKRAKRILRHERREMMYMKKGYNYKQAHKMAGYKKVR